MVELATCGKPHSYTHFARFAVGFVDKSPVGLFGQKRSHASVSANQLQAHPKLNMRPWWNWQRAASRTPTLTSLVSLSVLSTNRP